ncbi:hypothetical protein TIFTF001_027048 [Ficus carica]|uniref:Uncharacterized protein n=1 Tax=Ficus carica TaxID=3494 RepID=A0AA88DMC1_FICCA|nr:hypothetical protein TIFTF001_027048 [Ficus carica]
MEIPNMLAMANKDVASSLNCRVLAIKQPPSSPSAAAAAAAAGTKTKTRTTTTSATALALDCSTNLDFSHIELAGLQ